MTKLEVLKLCGEVKKIEGSYINPNHHNSTHGLSHTRLFHIWRSMKARCGNPKHKYYQYYGGVGISVCGKWEKDFSAFALWAVNSGYKNHLTIDRVDFNGNYEPKNCKWSTMKEQNNHKRDKIILRVGNKRMCLREIEERFGVRADVCAKRIRDGWDVQRATQQPMRARNMRFLLNGQNLTLNEMSRSCGIPRNTLYTRIVKRGLTAVEAIAHG